jgi:hypothetical protein
MLASEKKANCGREDQLSNSLSYALQDSLQDVEYGKEHVTQPLRQASESRGRGREGGGVNGRQRLK